MRLGAISLPHLLASSKPILGQEYHLILFSACLHVLSASPVLPQHFL